MMKRLNSLFSFSFLEIREIYMGYYEKEYSSMAEQQTVKSVGVGSIPTTISFIFASSKTRPKGEDQNERTII